MTPHLNRLDEMVQMRDLDETVQMRGHNIWFLSEIRKIIIKYSLSRALLSEYTRTFCTITAIPMLKHSLVYYGHGYN